MSENVPDEEDEVLSYGEVQVNQLRANYFKIVNRAPSKKSVKCHHCLTYFASPFSLRRHMNAINKKELLKNNPKLAPLSHLPLHEMKAAIYGSRKKKANDIVIKVEPREEQSVTVDPLAENTTELRPYNHVVWLVDPNAETQEQKPTNVEASITTMHSNPENTSVINISSDSSQIFKKKKTTTKTSERLLCHECGKQFSDRKTLRAHQKSHTISEFKCKICFAKLASLMSLRRHMFTHPDITGKQFICETCGKRFAYRMALMHHKRSHTEFRPYVCRICARSFKSASNRRAHEVATHKIGFCVKTHSCPTCFRSFQKKETLDRHINQHSGEMDFKCNECHQRFFSNTGLNIHTSLGRCYKYIHSCRHCRRIFKADETLCAHLQSVKKESGEKSKNISCTLCDKKFLFTSQMNYHYKLAHSDVKPFQCELCPKMFKTKSALAIHNDVHGDVRRHVCTVCGKLFRRACNLKVHIRTHTGEKPYVCEICSRGFAQKGDKDKHVLKIHQAD